MISTDVIFDEFTMLSFKKESSNSCHAGDNMQKQVAFEIDSSGTFIQQMLVNASESTDETNSNEEQYFIAKNRSRRDIRPPQRYVDLVAYALSVAEKLMK